MASVVETQLSPAAKLTFSADMQLGYNDAEPGKHRDHFGYAPDRPVRAAAPPRRRATASPRTSATRSAASGSSPCAPRPNSFAPFDNSMNYALLPPTAHAAVADRVDCEFRSLDVAAHATALAFDAGGHYLAAGYGDGSLLVWDLCLRGGAALPPLARARRRSRRGRRLGGGRRVGAAVPGRRRRRRRLGLCAAGALAEAARLDLGAAGRAAGLSCAAGVARRRGRAAGAPAAGGEDAGARRGVPRPAAAACLLRASPPPLNGAAVRGLRGGAATLGPALALGGGAATGLSAAPGGKLVALTSDDGAVRLLGVGAGALPALELRHALRDHVDRLSWRACAFGAAGERVVAGASRSWRAFAPGFEELHENTRHEEREDEFDTVLDAPDAAAPPPPPRPSSPVEILAPAGMTRPGSATRRPQRRARRARRRRRCKVTQRAFRVVCVVE
ncbi:hypothetical protein JL721_4397 [Aureococcus anophagefferens]|nr:hypothetical protein JL721_4397 [Aureococcus anophagefferens]